MLALFRTNQFAVNVLLILYTLIIRGALFIVPANDWSPSDAGVLSEFLYAAVGTTGLLPELVACLLIFIQAIIVNMMVGRNRLASQITLFPGLFYILIASSLPEFLHLSPVLIANTFYLVAVWELFGIYHKTGSTGRLFNAGLWIGVASLCYFSFLTFLLLGIISIALLRAFRLSEIMSFLSGIFVPFFLSCVYFFVVDQLPAYWQTFDAFDFSIYKGSAAANWETYTKLGFFGLLVLIAIFNYSNYTSKKELKAQKQIGILFWSLLLGGFSIIFPPVLPLEHLLILALPLGIFMALNFLNLKPATAELLHTILFFSILLMHFKQYWL